MLSRSRLLQLFVMLFILFALIGWRTLYPINNLTLDEDNTEREDVKVERVRCDYFTPCELIAEQGRFWLSVNNPPIKAEQWINFNLQSELKSWQVIEAKIVGKSMFMGRIPVSFMPAANAAFTAKSLLGACTTDEMIWQMQIMVEVEGIQELLHFDFMVRR